MPQVVRPAGGPLLPGVGTGDVFVRSATEIFRVELATGRVTRTLTPRLAQFSSFVAGPGWVVSKAVDTNAGVVVRNGQPATALPQGLQPTGRLDTAPGGQLWFTPEEETRGVRLVRRVGIDGRPLEQPPIRLPDEVGSLSADGAGYLIRAEAGGVFQYRPSGARRVASGDLIAIGGRFLLVWDCDEQAQCDPYRATRADDSRTKLAAARQYLRRSEQRAAVQSSFYGELSPDGTHVVVPAPADPNRWSISVLDLRTGTATEIPGVLADSNLNTLYAWTANSRWLLAITDDQLRAYDTKTRTTRTIALTTEPLLHLTRVGAAGN